MEIRIQAPLGCNIEGAVNLLYHSALEIREVMVENHVLPVDYNSIVTTLDFNGHKLTSEDSVDDAYLRITGLTKEQSDAEDKRLQEEYDKREQEWKDSMPSRIEPCRQMARGIIREDQYDFWDEIVPIRLGDMYHGMELDACLEILKEWNESKSFFKCHQLLLEQGHSGWSHGLVLKMVQKFAKGDAEEVGKLIRILNNPTYNEEA